MKLQPAFVLLALSLSSGAQASWFGSDDPAPAYNTWSTGELKDWLVKHNIAYPSSSNSREDLLEVVKSNYDAATSWTQDQYASAQKSFSDLRDTSFDAWDESQLRAWLLEQGVVAPKGKKEELQLLAKQRYKEYQAAASKWGDWVGATTNTATESLSSLAATATAEAERVFDDSKDYVYSTWDDNKLRSYLEEKGVIKTKQEKTREEMLALMKEYYAAVTNPVYNAWSTSYIHNWLVAHNIVAKSPTPAEKARATLVTKMNDYYYSTNDYVWTTWDDSEMRAWLIANGYMKSDAQAKRDKMVKMMQDNYNTATSTVVSAWTDSQLRDWLIANGYMRSDAQVKRDEMVKMIQDKYSAASSTAQSYASPYLSWPNNRLRAYLVERGVSEKNLPKTREGLLQRTRSMFSYPYYRVHNEPESLLDKVRDVLNSGVDIAEDKVMHIWDLMTGYGKDAEKKGYEAKGKAEKKGEEAKGSFWGKYDEGKEKVKSEL